jgi:hypothetical protein
VTYSYDTPSCFKVASAYSLNFPGATVAVSASPSSAQPWINFTDNFAVEIWAKPANTAGGNRCLIYNGASGANGWGIYQTGNQFKGLLGGVTWVGSHSAVAGEWTHLALVRASGVTTLYVNGVAAGSSNSAPNTPNGDFTLGGVVVALSPGECFEGQLDELRVVTFPPGGFDLSKLLYADPITVLRRYGFGDGDSGALPGMVMVTTSDDTGSGPLTAAGTPAYSSLVPFIRAIPSALCVDFPGGSLASAGNVVTSLTDNFAMEVWVRPETTATGNRCIMYNGTSSSNGWGIFQVGNQYKGLFGGVTWVGSRPVVAGLWTHLALVRDAGVATLYVNGVAAGSSSSAPNPPSGAFSVAGVTLPTPAEYFDGQLDEARVFSFQPKSFSSDLFQYMWNPWEGFFTLQQYYFGDLEYFPVVPGAPATIMTGLEEVTASFTGSATYVSDDASFGGPRGGHSVNFPGSTMAISGSGGPPINLDDNFGMEVWVKPSVPAGTRCISYNGTPGSNGWGIYQMGGQYRGVFGGVTQIGSYPVEPNLWTHLALVRDMGVTTFYVNGVPAGATTTAAPITPNGAFIMGGRSTTSVPGEHFIGRLDEVRIFTFEPYHFRPRHLWYPMR